MVRLPLAVLVLAGLLAPATPAAATETAGRSTLEQRIEGGARSTGSYSSLRPAPGRARRVREDGIGQARAGRDDRRRSLLYLAQLSDFQLADEETPARVEVVDAAGGPVSSAWRPQEALAPWTIDASIRQVNRFGTSPVAQADGRRARLALAITTGDNADSNQRNEVEWVTRLLEGGRLDPNSGSADPAAYAGCPPGTPGPDEAARYTGVQDARDTGGTTRFYDPERPAGPWARWPRHPGLMDRAQRAFDATGLLVPSYVAIGNHDTLVQGNQTAVAAIESIATGCVKVTPTADALPDPAAGLLGRTGPATLVPPDPRRRFVTKHEYRRILGGGRQADAHGFGFVDPAEDRAAAGSVGYYDFSPRPGVRLVALDTVSEAGVIGPSSDGNIDTPQARWLERVLRRAATADEVVVLYSHHAPVSLTADVPDEMAPPCTTSDPAAHDPNPGCDRDPRSSSPVLLGDQMVALVQRHPNVIAWVAGHSHVNDVRAYPRRGGGGFWVVRTSAEADWPHQDRLVELMDNRDGTLSLFGTLLDNASPIEAPPAGTAAAGLGRDELASLARTLGYNDPQAGGGTGEGQADDDNVELLIRDPRRSAGNGAGAGEGSRRTRLRVRVAPRRVRAGRRTRFRFRVTINGRPLRGAKIALAGRRIRTNRRGRAVLRVTLRRRGYARVRAGTRGRRRAETRVRVLARR